MAAPSNAATALRRVDLFSSLSDKSLGRLATRTSTVQHAPGKEVAIEGRTGIGFHLLLDGSAEVLVGDRPVRTLGPGDYFGEISLIDGKPRSATVRTAGGMTTLSLPAWGFAPLLDEEPAICKALLLALCGRLRTAEAREHS